MYTAFYIVTFKVEIKAAQKLDIFYMCVYIYKTDDLMQIFLTLRKRIFVLHYLGHTHRFKY